MKREPEDRFKHALFQTIADETKKKDRNETHLAIMRELVGSMDLARDFAAWDHEHVKAWI